MAQIVFAFDKQSARSKDADGRMRVKNCILSTAEINPYRGKEIPGWDKLGLSENAIYELYRDPTELEKAVPTFEGIPLMVKHIPQTAEDPRKEYQCGSVHTIRFDGKYLRGDLLVSDGYAIELIEEDELSDLSCGYRYKPDMVSGSNGSDKYDGVMRNIEGNHVALVDDGRATGAHVADAALKTGDSKMAFPENNEAKPAAAPAAPVAGQPPEVSTTAAPAAPAGPDMAAVGAALKALAGQVAQLTAMVQPPAPAVPAVPAAPAAPAAPVAAADEDSEKTDAANVRGLEGALESGALAARKMAVDEDASGGEQVGKPDNGNADIALTPATEGMEGSMGTSEAGGEGATIPAQAPQTQGTPARGGNTPIGAMDSKTVESMIAAAVKADRAERAKVDEAKRDVRGVLGEVYGMDNSGDIYREALKQVGVDVSELAAGQEKLAWGAYKVAAGHAAGVRKQPDMAMDAAGVSDEQKRVTSNISRIKVAG